LAPTPKPEKKEKIMKSWAIWALVALALGVGFYAGQSDRAASSPADLTPAEFRLRMEEALTNPVFFERTVLMTELLQHLNADNLEAGVEALEKELDRTPETGIRLFVRVWADLDLRGAYERILTWPRPKMKHGMAELIFVWASQDPVGAREALQKIPFEMVREVAVSSLVGGWAQGGQPGIEDFLMTLSSGGLQTKLTAVTATWKLRRDGPEATLAWAESQPQEDEWDGFRKVAMERAANQVAPLEPEMVARWAEKHWDQTYARTVPRELAKRWFPADADAAMAWLTGLDDPEKRDELIDTGFRRWSQLDGRSASQWLTTTELTPVHDPAIAIFSTELTRAEPERALLWAQRIHDDELRKLSQTNALRVWLQRSPGPAAAWLEGGLLEPEVVAAAKQPAHRAGSQTGGRRPKSQAGQD